MLKKAGIVVAAATAGLLALSPLAFAGDYNGDGDGDGGDGGHHGSSATCKQVEPGWICPNNAGTGGPCTMAPREVCGDGKLSFGEYCDDGNTRPGDGCSADCKVDPGWTCPAAGMACRQVEWCGNGKVSFADGEQCDDNNTAGGDGCSAQCIIEANYVYPTAGAL